MAKKQTDLLFNNELTWEEQQRKNRKLFYKNWKTYAIALGIIVIGTGTGLGIYYGVNANHPSTPRITDEDIINKINDAKYEKSVDLNTKAEAITIDATFIKEKLIGEFKTAFKDGSFKYEGIMVGENPLTDENLKVEGTIEATIAYTYGEITAKVNLQITVVTTPTDQSIWQKIMDGKYELTIATGTPVKEIYTQIKNMVQSQLPELYKKYFDPLKFVHSNIWKKVDNKNVLIDDRDIKEPGVKNFGITCGYRDTEPAVTDIEFKVTFYD